MKEPNEALAPEAPPGTPEANLSGPAKPEKSPLLREVRSLAVRLAVFAAVLWVLLTQVYLVTQASGSEMFPAVKDGDLVLGIRLEKDYAKNDVVVYERSGRLRVGRVLARRADGGAGPDGTNVRPAKRKGGELIMRRLPKMAAALLAAALAVSAALPALAADQRAELELEASVRCTGEAADETLTVRLTALDGAPMPEGCDDEAELDFPARDCRDADDKTLTKTFDAIAYTAPGIYEYTVTQDAGGRKRADYDDTVFYLKVMVAWDTDGELKGHVSVRRDGDDGAKTELLFKNSYRSTDPLPPPVTPPYVPDKPTPTPKSVEQPGEITVIRPPTPSAEMPDEVIPAAEPEPVGTLIQTGQLLWPVPVLAGGGIALVAVGLWLSRKRRHDA